MNDYVIYCKMGWCEGCWLKDSEKQLVASDHISIGDIKIDAWLGKCGCYFGSCRKALGYFATKVDTALLSLFVRICVCVQNGDHNLCMWGVNCKRVINCIQVSDKNKFLKMKSILSKFIYLFPFNNALWINITPEHDFLGMVIGIT